MRHISNFQKINNHQNRDNLAVPLVVEFLKSVDFQQRYNAFSETPLHIILIHQVCYSCRHVELRVYVCRAAHTQVRPKKSLDCVTKSENLAFRQPKTFCHCPNGEKSLPPPLRKPRTIFFCFCCLPSVYQYISVDIYKKKSLPPP